jgi:hypothetical protein
MPERVECYSGYEYPERPYAFHWQDRRLEVSEVMQTWRTPQGKYFQVKTEDMQIFELVYKESEDDWLIVQIR